MSRKKLNKNEIYRILDTYNAPSALYIVSNAFLKKHQETLIKNNLEYELKQNEYYPVVVQHKYKEKFQLKKLK